MNDNTTPTRPPHQRVLIVCHADGWLEAFAERNIDVHIAQMPAMKSAEGRIAAEAYLDATLPYPYRKLFVPNKRRAADMLREVRPSDIAERNWRLDMLNVLDGIGSISDSGGEVWIA